MHYCKIDYSNNAHARNLANLTGHDLMLDKTANQKAAHPICFKPNTFIANTFNKHGIRQKIHKVIRTARKSQALASIE